jgi:beta-lactamase regulating signal transducer with metallopeptidase domain
MTLLLGWTLLHFVWQGLAVAALLASLNVLLRHADPLARYRLASATLVAMLLLPVGTFQALRASPGPAAADSSPSAVPAVTGGGTASLATSSPVSRPTGPESSPGTWKRRLEPLLPAFVGLWAAGVVLLSLRSLGGFALVQRLRRSGLAAPPPAVEVALRRLVERLRVAAPVVMYESALVRVPTVVGWLRPVILVPASALAGLSPLQLELVLAHELAHVRRLDYLVNLLQTLAETLLFYHPAVWWVSERMRVEREHCCDDLAVATCGNPVRYARTLADLGELCADAPALAMAASGGALLERVSRLVAGPPRLSAASRSLGVALTVSSLGLALGLGSQLVARPTPALAAIAQEVAPEAGPKAKPAPVPPARPAAQPQPKSTGEPQRRALPMNRVLDLARAGVTPEYVDEMDALGYASLTADQLIALRHQGVTAEYVRELAAEGYQGLTVDDLLSLRSQGVTPKYVAELKAAGQTDLSVTSLLMLRSQGVSGQYVSELVGLGYDKMSQSRLLALRAQGVTPEYVRSLAELGYRGIDTKVLLALRAQGVTPEYARELKEAGYAGLPAGSLIELRATGVTPEFVRELKAAGYEKLSTEELVRLRASGWSGKRVKRSERPSAGEKP